MLPLPLALCALLLIYAAAIAAVWLLPDAARRIFSVVQLEIAIIALFDFGAALSPVERLLFSTVLLLGLLKCSVALRRPRAEIRAFAPLGLATYFCAWPGLEMRPFARRVARDASTQTDDAEKARSLFRGAACALAGFALLTAVSWNLPRLGFQSATWLALAALLLGFHFGFGAILPWAVRQLGFAVGPLFRAPERAQSLADFWSRRWNLPFIEMDRILFLRPLRRRLGSRGALFGVFVVSGLFHEIGISYPAGGGWGGPLFYFVLQGALVALTPASAPFPKSLWLRALAWIVILAPLSLLFHAPFRAALLWPLVQFLHGLLHARPFNWYFSVALWLGGLGHFIILIASFQVPKQLGWREDFARLTRFNRKVFWTYGGFIVGTIIANGIFALALHGEMLRGERAGVIVSLWIGAFWSARVLTDFFYFGHEDWPRGALFEVGHTALTMLFCALAILFGVVVPLRAWL